MKCLSRIEMQEYIDDEVNSSISNEILKHLENCEKCSSVYKEVLADKALINKVLAIADSRNETQLIPDFEHPGKKKQSILRIATVLAAASIIGMLFLIRLKKEPVTAKIPEAEMLIYEFYDGKDLNQMWHEKSRIFIIQDEKGNVIQSIITY